MRIVSAVTLALCYGFVPGSASAQRPSQYDQFVAVEAPVIALTNEKVIDGTGAPAMQNQTVVLRGDRIVAVGPASQVSVPSGAEVLDLSGHTVMEIPAHARVTDRERSQRPVRSITKGMNWFMA